MANANSPLMDILNSLPDDELDMIEKNAYDSNTVVTNTENSEVKRRLGIDPEKVESAGDLTNTENSEARRKNPVEREHISKGQLGLSVLSNNKFQEDVRTLSNVSPNRSEFGSTENVSTGPKRVEPGVMFEKRAAEEAIEALYAISGVNLEKVASYDTEVDTLLKVASETIESVNDLEKVAEELAVRTADIFIEIISEVM